MLQKLREMEETIVQKRDDLVEELMEEILEDF